MDIKGIIILRFLLHFYYQIITNLYGYRVYKPTGSTRHMYEVSLSQLVIDQKLFESNMIKQIIQWNQNIQPSLNMVKNQIISFLKTSCDHIQDKNQMKHIQNGQIKLKKLIEITYNVPNTLKMLIDAKCPNNFMRAYLAIIKNNQSILIESINLPKIIQNWKNISSDLLESYLQAFNLKFQGINDQQQWHISQQQVALKVQQLLMKKKYENCLKLIQLSGCSKYLINQMLIKMATNKQASKAADYVKLLKLNPKDYPFLADRLTKSTARHFLNKIGWQYAEQIFQHQPETLAYVFEDLIYKVKQKQALSIWYRCKAIQHYILKQDARLMLQKFIKMTSQQCQTSVVRNNLQYDKFGIEEKKHYLTLEYFHIYEGDVIWVDQKHPELQVIMKNIIDASYIGIDTESVVGQTKFDKHNSKDIASTVQIALKDRIYIFDGFCSNNPIIRQGFKKYLQKDGIIIGHSLQNDMHLVWQSFGFTTFQIENLNQRNIVDICTIFKTVYPDKKFSSLVFICKEILGAEISKQQTLTNWCRRPLRRNQLHYAALDAFIVLKIYEKFIVEYGEQMINYYCFMQNCQL